jgi:hypothetical protein
MCVYIQAADDGTEVATAHDKLAQARAAAAAAAKQIYTNSGTNTVLGHYSSLARCSILNQMLIAITI